MIRLHLPDLPGFARRETMFLPAGCCPDVEACLASGTLLLEQVGIETARLDTECLVASALGCARWQLLLDRRRRLSREEFCQVLRLIRRRERREPLAYILGTREFWSLPLSVSAGVLVPRPETETLVEAALAAWKEMGAGRQVPSDGSREAGARIVELCTGSGAVAIAMASEMPTARILATDVSWRALRVARANAERNGVARRIDFLRGDLWCAVNGQAPVGSVDLVVANPPYIPTAEMATLMPEVRWEPRLALDGGEDGLRVIREIVATSPDRIRPGGFLLLEIGADQAAAVRALTDASGRFEPARVRCDLAGHPRVVVARRLQM
jgi:release factor glutamine methyltransferase